MEIKETTNSKTFNFYVPIVIHRLKTIFQRIENTWRGPIIVLELLAKESPERVCTCKSCPLRHVTGDSYNGLLWDTDNVLTIVRLYHRLPLNMTDATYSVKETGMTVNHLFNDSLGALPRVATKVWWLQCHLASQLKHIVDDALIAEAIHIDGRCCFVGWWFLKIEYVKT